MERKMLYKLNKLKMQLEWRENFFKTYASNLKKSIKELKRLDPEDLTILTKQKIAFLESKLTFVNSCLTEGLTVEVKMVNELIQEYQR